MTTNASPRPWRVKFVNSLGAKFIDADGRAFRVQIADPDIDFMRGIVEQIQQAVNAHDELVAALEAAHTSLRDLIDRGGSLGDVYYATDDPPPPEGDGMKGNIRLWREAEQAVAKIDAALARARGEA